MNSIDGNGTAQGNDVKSIDGNGTAQGKEVKSIDGNGTAPAKEVTSIDGNGTAQAKEKSQKVGRNGPGMVKIHFRRKIRKCVPTFENCAETERHKVRM